jgi:hypothetical protein
MQFDASTTQPRLSLNQQLDALQAQLTKIKNNVSPPEPSLRDVLKRLAQLETNIESSQYNCKRLITDHFDDMGATALAFIFVAIFLLVTYVVKAARAIQQRYRFNIVPRGAGEVPWGSRSVATPRTFPASSQNGRTTTLPR